MADPMAVVPYHDPFDDNQSTQNILMLDENPSLSLAAELPTLAEPNSLPPSNPPQCGDEIMAVHANNDHPFLWSILNDTDTIGSSQAGPWQIRGETNSNQQQEEDQNLEFGNPMQLPIWPSPPVPYSCTCCQVLREITHTDGICVTKLEIHGRLGIITHAVLENRRCIVDWDWDYSQNPPPPPPPQYQMFDFCKKSIDSVKQFLVQYCKGRKQAGYAMVQDPLLIFYEALCVGLNGHVDDANILDDATDDDFLQETSPSPTDDSVEGQINHPPETMNQQLPPRNSLSLSLSLAAQRERAGKLSLNDLKEYFHLPIDEAAKKMNICPTVVKKICRRGGLSRWPYRKIKSIEKKIATKIEASLNAHDIEEMKRARAEIERLQQELAAFKDSW